MKNVNLGFSVAWVSLSSIGLMLGWFGPASAVASASSSQFPGLEESGYDARDIQAALTRVSAARELAAASRTYGDADMSEKMKEYRDKFLQIQTPEQLDSFLDETEKSYGSFNDNDLKYFVAQIQLIRPFRSIVYRLRPIFEHDKAIQSSAVSVLRSIASNLMIYLPTDQWKAGFSYVTVPSATHDDTNQQWTKISEFQDFLLGAAPTFATAAKRVAAIYKTHPQKPMVWDNKLLYGIGSFPESMDRYRAHGDAEMAAFLSGIHLTLQSIAAFCAYNQDELLDFAEELGHLYGMNGFKSLFPVLGDDLGVSAQDRTNILKESKYATFLTLKKGNDPKDGASLMLDSFRHLTAAVKYANAAWQVLQGSSEDDMEFFNPVQFRGSKREGDARLRNIQAMLAGRTELRSNVTDEAVTVDLPGFFRNPPKDLKAFLPNHFDQSEENLTVTASTGSTLSYHNYLRGRAIAWEPAAWKKLVPSINAPQDTATAIRILRQSWGGDYVSPVLDFIAQ